MVVVDNRDQYARELADGGSVRVTGYGFSIAPASGSGEPLRRVLCDSAGRLRCEPARTGPRPLRVCAAEECVHVAAVRYSLMPSRQPATRAQLAALRALAPRFGKSAYRLAFERYARPLDAVDRGEADELLAELRRTEAGLAGDASVSRRVA